MTSASEKSVASLQEFVCARALPLFLRWRETAATDPHVRPLGTGWLLRYGDAVLLVTAAHVLEDLREEKQVDDLVVTRGVGRDLDIIAISGDRYLDGSSDVGFLKLDPDVVGALETAEFPFVDFSALDASVRPSVDHRAIAGWPVELRPPTRIVREVDAKRYAGECFYAFGVVAGDEPGPPGSDLTRIYLPLDATSRLPMLQGISGAAVWGLDSCGAPRVIGVETDVVRDAEVSIIVATPIIRLIELIRSNSRSA